MTIIVKALPWHTNAPRDGTWWVGYEGQVSCYDDHTYVVAHGSSRHNGTDHAEAVLLLEKHIADAQAALDFLKRGREYGEFSE